MRHIIKCKLCGVSASVNGQKQIEAFGSNHHHGMEKREYITGQHLELDEPQPSGYKPLITGFDSSPRKDYWRKIPGGM